MRTMASNPSHIGSTVHNRPNNTATPCSEEPPTRRRSAAPIAAMSAEILSVLATINSATMPVVAQKGITRRILAANPCPVSQPMRALTSWIPIINGVVNAMVHNNPAPNWAPACE